jgi:hypothetical protein
MLIESLLDSSGSQGLWGVRTWLDNSQGQKGHTSVATASETCRNKTLPAEDREERQKQTQDNADNDAGDDGEIKRGVFALNTNVARQPAKPSRRETAPHDQADQCGDHADNDDEFSQFAHHSKSCANQTDAQA